WGQRRRLDNLRAVLSGCASRRLRVCARHDCLAWGGAAVTRPPGTSGRRAVVSSTRSRRRRGTLYRKPRLVAARRDDRAARLPLLCAVAVAPARAALVRGPPAPCRVDPVFLVRGEQLWQHAGAPELSVDDRAAMGDPPAVTPLVRWLPESVIAGCSVR